MEWGKEVLGEEIIYRKEKERERRKEEERKWEGELMEENKGKKRNDIE